MLPYTFSAALKSVNVKYDVLHVLKPTPMTCPGYMGKFLRGIPVVQDIDDLDHTTMAAEKHPKTSIWFMTQLEKIIPKFADQIIVSCSPLRQLYSHMGLRSKITQISNGVFVDDFVTDVDTSLKEKYGLREKVVVYVGSLNNEAQLRPLLFSMQNIVNEKKNVSCLIVGDGIARQSLQHLGNSLNLRDFVVFAGKVPHSMVPRFLSISDIGFACFPKLDYFNYASNIKVFEYMASGVPAVVSPTGDLPYYIDYGRAGVVSNSDVTNLSNVLISLLTDERKRKKLGSYAKKYAVNFDWTVLTQKLVDTYMKIAN
jgi:glycosyltransferase involved in cell wall biosynthesis